MKKSLLTVLHYFGYFSYPPSFDEIYTYYPKKIRKKDLQTLLTSEVERGSILRLPYNKSFAPSKQAFFDYNFRFEFPRYTLPQYSISCTKSQCVIPAEAGIQPHIFNTKTKKDNYRLDPLLRGDDKKNISKSKKIPLAIHIYVQLLKWLPFVRFVGVTGASAVAGVKESDDIDLCIVSKGDLLWTTRFFAIVFAKILRVHHKTGVCLNLFFDEFDLTMPKKKHSVYIAHELLQMKPLIDKDGVYRRFCSENRWIYRHFPNMRSKKTGDRRKNKAYHFIASCFLLLTSVFNLFEHFFKSIQLPIIRRNKTAFFITSTQLWLFKNDFEKKLKRSRLVL